MRIISNFKDYYDCVQGTDPDRETLFKREEIEVFKEYNVRNHRQDPLWVGFPYFCDYSGNSIIIGFCGKFYPLIQISYKGKDHFCYKIEEIDEFMEDNFKKKEVKKYYEGGKHKYDKPIRNDYKDFFPRDFTKFSNLFETAPIFVALEKNHQLAITYNAFLKHFEFFKAVEPFTAYQELRMFVENIAVPIKPIPVLDDVTMAESKGFDKYSFRKEKQK